MLHAFATMAMRNDRVVLLPHELDNLPAFLDWYADPELARLTRHDQTPLTACQIRAFFQDCVLPMSEQGHAFGIHTANSRQLIGTCSLTDFSRDGRQATLRILIGPAPCWGRGYGTAAVSLLVGHGFDHLGLREIVLGVFDFNQRAIHAYQKVGFRTAATIRLTMPPDSPQASEVLMTLTPDAYRRCLPFPPRGRFDVRR